MTGYAKSYTKVRKIMLNLQDNWGADELIWHHKMAAFSVTSYFKVCYEDLGQLLGRLTYLAACLITAVSYKVPSFSIEPKSPH